VPPRLLIINQYYWPGVEATANLLTELAEDFAADFDVTVVTGDLHGHAGLPRREVRNGVLIIRVPSLAYERSRLSRRALNYVSFLATALVRGLSDRRPDIVICMTDPPVVGDVALLVARRFRVPLLVISEDVFPEVAVELKRLESPLLVGALRRLVRLYLSRTDRVVAIGETMRERLIDKGVPAERIEVIPNWVDTQAITPRPRDNDWAREQELVGKFVVMHSGNVGHAQGLETLVLASTPGQ
jgi:colanic acid biosynthesis glycosyl transferase WcaI